MTSSMPVRPYSPTRRCAGSLQSQAIRLTSLTTALALGILAVSLRADAAITIDVGRRVGPDVAFFGWDSRATPCWSERIER